MARTNEMPEALRRAHLEWLWSFPEGTPRSVVVLNARDPRFAQQLEMYRRPLSAHQFLGVYNVDDKARLLVQKATAALPPPGLKVMMCV